ncbi:MAG: hypothetical protein ACOYMG_26145 [Candidatus Methylumidiphilus sp.]
MNLFYILLRIIVVGCTFAIIVVLFFILADLRADHKARLKQEDE